MAPRQEGNGKRYKQDMDKLRSIALVSLLKEAPDLLARHIVENYSGTLSFDEAARHDLMIEEEAWSYIESKGYAATQIFCHPDLLMSHPSVSLYYRGLTGLSRKAVGQLSKSVDKAETNPAYVFRTRTAALAIARLYNLFICSIIIGSEGWALENGYRTILATMGITFDGSSRNKVGDVAERRIRIILLEYVVEKGLISEDEVVDLSALRPQYRLKNGYMMKFSDEPDVYFTDPDNLAIGTIEIKGGLDPAGALERLGAAQRSFLHAIRATANCKTYLIAGVVTRTMEERLLSDRNFTKHFSMVDILTDTELRDSFLFEVFHYGLRLLNV